MKKRIIILATCAAVIILVLYCYPIYRIIELADPSYYNRYELGMLVCRGSYEDREAAKRVVNVADSAFGDLSHTREENLLNYGVLSRYATAAERGAVRETHELDMLSAHFDDTTGYIWVRYTNTAYAAGGEVVHGNNGILSLWYLEKDDSGEWKVTYIKEHP